MKGVDNLKVYTRYLTTTVIKDGRYFHRTKCLINDIRLLTLKGDGKIPTETRR